MCNVRKHNVNVPGSFSSKNVKCSTLSDDSSYVFVILLVYQFLYSEVNIMNTVHPTIRTA